jgi:nucleoside-diphosphate-sugar epimerase
MRRQVPGCVDLYFPGVDIRDVSAAHLAALTHPEAAGRRYILHAETLSMQALAQALHHRFAARGYRIPHHKLPNFFTHILGLVDPVARRMVPYLGISPQYENRRMVEELGITPRPLAESFVDMAESMIAHGML